MTFLTELKDKNILVLGAGLTGLSCAKYLRGLGLSFVVNDSRDNVIETSKFNAQFTNAKLISGQWCQKTISCADLILVSPGIDIVASGISAWINDECQVIGDVELFCKINNARINPVSILAVTGSNGKSTVVSLVAYIAKMLGVNAQLGGNIGLPVLELLQLENATSIELASQPEMLILELSSFQLETLNSMKAIAATMLNLSDDHLDRHLTMDNYQAIKQRIYPQAETAVYNRDDKATIPTSSVEHAISFGSDKPADGHFGIHYIDGKAYLAFGEQTLISLAELPLAGMHNALNYLAALALGYSAGWSLSAMSESLTGFTGLAHRCQRIATADDVQWINDSKATNVGATIAAIKGLANTKSRTSNLILIAGGEGKGADFTPLHQVFENHVSSLITFGKDGNAIALQSENTSTTAHEVTTLQEAVNLANSLVNAGDIVLLSPACASLDMYKNYIARGEHFIDLVQETVQTTGESI